MDRPRPERRAGASRSVPPYLGVRITVPPEKVVQ